MPELKTLFFFYMQEGMFLAYLGLALIGIRLPLKKVVTIGIIQGLMVYLVRSLYITLGIPFGTHVIILLISLIVTIKLVAKVKLGAAAAGGLLSVIVLILSESMILPPVYEGLNLSLEKVLSEGWLNIIMGYVCDAFLILLTVFVALKKFTLIEVADSSQYNI